MLIDWASSSLEKSLNQPTLPHAVIALNAMDTKVDANEWDPVYMTKKLMSDVAGAVDRDPKYKDLKAKGFQSKRISNSIVEELN